MIGIPQAEQLHQLSAAPDARLTQALAEATALLVEERQAARVVVFAGPGGNGTDALEVALSLREAGHQVSIFVWNAGAATNVNDAPTCGRREQLREALAAQGNDLTEVTERLELPRLEGDCLLVDGLFGTGLTAPLTGGFAQLVRYLNSADCTIVSIDLPSGLMTDGNALGQNTSPCDVPTVQADFTLTLPWPKLAMYAAECQACLGEVRRVGDGMTWCTGEEEAVMAEVEANDVAALLRRRDPFGHKGTFGHSLLVAGSRGMAGAAILAAKACLRSGVGKVTVHTPGANLQILQTAVPEAVVSLDAADDVLTTPCNTDTFDATAIGPGLGLDGQTAAAFIGLVGRARGPLVVDADGINILSQHPSWLAELPQGTILTPHLGEMARLTKGRADTLAALAEARTLARRLRIYIVLKGHHTAICTPEGRVRFNPTGNSGMATAGAGDVLTGVLLALLAQGYGAEEACLLGVYLHGLAGDLAAEELGEESVTASDLVAHLPQAFKRLKSLLP